MGFSEKELRILKDFTGDSHVFQQVLSCCNSVLQHISCGHITVFQIMKSSTIPIMADFGLWLLCKVSQQLGNNLFLYVVRHCLFSLFSLLLPVTQKLVSAHHLEGYLNPKMHLEERECLPEGPTSEHAQVSFHHLWHTGIYYFSYKYKCMQCFR